MYNFYLIIIKLDNENKTHFDSYGTADIVCRLYR